jgi:urease accessory protein
VLQSTAGAVIDAPRLAGNTPVHQLSLRFETGQLRIRRQDPPWRVVRAFPQDSGLLLAHLHNVSGGVLAGDRLALDIEVAAGAIAQITTTGATRLYRHRAGAGDSEQRTRISVGAGAVLEYLPDPVIPYAGSRHTQRTEIQLAAGSALFWWEVVAPGRQAAGELFGFDRLRIENHIVSGTRPVLRENFVLDPIRRPLEATARMQRYSWTASLYICQPDRPTEFWRGLEDEFTEFARRHGRKDQAIWGASALCSDGVVARGLSTGGRFIHAALTELWQIARKRITGKDAAPPRKVY